MQFCAGTGFTRAEREATKELLGDIGSQIVADVAAGRRLTAEVGVYGCGYGYRYGYRAWRGGGWRQRWAECMGLAVGLKKVLQTALGAMRDSRGATWDLARCGGGVVDPGGFGG